MKNLVLRSRTKHIEVRHCFIRDHIEKGDCVIEHASLFNKLADIFTKPFPKDFFNNN